MGTPLHLGKKVASFSLTRYKDERVVALLPKTDKKTLAIWARDCALRVLLYFEKNHPDDLRPQNALKTLDEWIKTGNFRMAVIRKASLDSHAAAREDGEDSPARSTARACGQAVATAHVFSHSIGAAIYAQQAIHRTNNYSNDAAIAKEREWQYQHLLGLKKHNLRAK